MKTWAVLALVLFTHLAQAEPVGESTTARADKHWGWVGQLGNFTSGNISTVGLGAGLTIFLTTNDLLSLELGYGSNTDLFSSLSGDTVSGYSRWAGVYYKRFLINSFYVKGGFEDIWIHYSVSHNLNLNGSYSQTAELNLYSIFLGVGNQWQMGSFTIGCDWIGVVQPFANSGFTETDSGTPSGAWDLHERLTRTGLDIARFYLGMSF